MASAAACLHYHYQLWSATPIGEIQPENIEFARQLLKRKGELLCFRS